jgi:hypothetical protein
MENDEIAGLRRGAIAYYETHLDPESFGRTLAQKLTSLSELVVNDEWLLWSAVNDVGLGREGAIT